MIKNGKALETFKELVFYQGGNVNLVDEPDKFPKASYIVPVYTENTGYIERIETTEIGLTSLFLGVGEKQKKVKLILV